MEIDFLQAAECLKTIAHPDRLKMIHYLLEKGELSVGEIAIYCNLKNHVASEHLSFLKDRGFLKSQRSGRRVFYSVKEQALSSLMDCVKKKFGYGGKNDI